ALEHHVLPAGLLLGDQRFGLVGTPHPDERDALDGQLIAVVVGLEFRIRDVDFPELNLVVVVGLDRATGRAACSEQAQRRQKRRPGPRGETKPARHGPPQAPRVCARKRPVYDTSAWDASCSGVPAATTRPPASPPSGPRSTMWSAVFTTSRLCSMTTTVLP